MSVTFLIRRKLLSRRHYVFATLPSGEQIKIRRFHSEEDAESWLRYRASEWIGKHSKELGLVVEANKAKSETASTALAPA